MIDRNMTIRFYECITHQEAPEPMDTVLERILSLPMEEREKHTGNGVILRLETLELREDILVGDITRIQRENLPGEVQASTVAPLPADQIGHPISFCYDPHCQVIALQFEIKARINSVLSYIDKFTERGGYTGSPVLNAADFEKFGLETAKKFEFQVSGIRDFSNSQRDESDFEKSLREMGDVFNAPKITVTVEGSANQKLNGPSVFQQLRRLIKATDDTESIKRIKASTEEERDPYNFIDQLLVERTVISVPNNEPEEARRLRLNHLSRIYGRHKSRIRSQLNDR